MGLSHLPIFGTHESPLLKVRVLMQFIVTVENEKEADTVREQNDKDLYERSADEQ
jgi:hypothetical protein